MCRFLGLSSRVVSVLAVHLWRHARPKHTGNWRLPEIQCEQIQTIYILCELCAIQVHTEYHAAKNFHEFSGSIGIIFRPWNPDRKHPFLKSCFVYPVKSHPFRPFDPACSHWSKLQPSFDQLPRKHSPRGITKRSGDEWSQWRPPRFWWAPWFWKLCS